MSHIAEPLSMTDSQLVSMGLRRSAVESVGFGGGTWWTSEKISVELLNYVCDSNFSTAIPSPYSTILEIKIVSILTFFALIV